MCLPTDEQELRRWAKFVISRWQLEHAATATMMQAICLGIPLTCEDYWKIVRVYVQCRHEVKTGAYRN